MKLRSCIRCGRLHEVMDNVNRSFCSHACKRLTQQGDQRALADQPPFNSVEWWAEVRGTIRRLRDTLTRQGGL